MYHVKNVTTQSKMTSENYNTVSGENASDWHERIKQLSCYNLWL